MRIGVLTTVHAPLDTRIYFKEAASLAAAGHHVILVARRGPAGGKRIRRVHLPGPRRRLERIGLAVRVFAAARRLRCDVYHFHDPELLPVGVALKIATGARVVFDVHEHIRMQILDKRWIPVALRPLVARIYGMIEASCLRGVDHVILAMPTFAQHYTSRPVTVIHNYPLLRPEEVSIDLSSESLHWPRLVYCGMVTRIRGALQMLDVVALMKRDFPNVHLTVIGPTESPTLADEIAERIRREDLAENVALTDRLPIHEAMRRIARCDIGLALFLPCENLAFALPTKILEYMTCGKPVILSDVGLGAPIVRSAACGVVVPPGNAAAAAQALMSLLAGGAERARQRLAAMGERGRQAVLQNYQWSVEERRLLEVYASLQAGCRRSGGRPGHLLLHDRDRDRALAARERNREPEPMGMPGARS